MVSNYKLLVNAIINHNCTITGIDVVDDDRIRAVYFSISNYKFHAWFMDGESLIVENLDHGIAGRRKARELENTFNTYMVTHKLTP